MILPIGAKDFTEAMKMGSEVYHNLKSVIKKKCAPTPTFQPHPAEPLSLTPNPQPHPEPRASPRAPSLTPPNPSVHPYPQSPPPTP